MGGGNLLVLVQFNGQVLIVEVVDHVFRLRHWLQPLIGQILLGTLVSRLHLGAAVFRSECILYDPVAKKT